MPSQTLKVVIPMAGYGARLRPHTWSRPKQLLNVAGKSVLDHVLDTFVTLPDPKNIELIFIVGYLGEKIEAYMNEVHPDLNVKYVAQQEMRGQSHAIYLAKEYLGGPMLMVFADTLVETDLAFLATDPADAVVWVRPVPDPRRFGVAAVDEGGWVTRLIEKPKSMDNNLAVVGFYYFSSSEHLIAAIEEQMRRDIQLKGEYFLADAVNIMLENGLKMHTQNVDVWLDAGTPVDILRTNRYLLEHGHDNNDEAQTCPGVIVIPPVYVHPSAEIQNSVVGPNVTVGANCKINHSIIHDSIIEAGAEVSQMILDSSLIGCDAVIEGRARVVTIGDNSLLTL